MLKNLSAQHLAEKLLKAGPVPLRLKLWNGSEIALSPNPAVTFKLRSPSVLNILRSPNLAKLGEAFVEGKLELEGSVCDAFRIATNLSRELGHTTLAWLPKRLRHSRRKDAEAIRYHYDVSNDFYALWLDRNMAYSCAYFKTGEESIDCAQEQKFDHICRKLQLKPGERFLDIGCGWGGLIRWAAKHYGVKAVGVTLSRNQYEYAGARSREDRLENNCRVLLQDYRDIPGEETYDKIASVGMFEHVGLKNLPAYFGVIYRLLRVGGLVLNHGITSMSPDNKWVGLGAGDFVERYVFPGGEVPHLSLELLEMAKQGIEVVDVESLRQHYALTLRHWSDRLEQNRDQARAIAGEKRYRIWTLYLAGCCYAFEQAWVSVHQVLGLKSGSGTGRPWTRDYMYSKPAEA